MKDIRCIELTKDNYKKYIDQVVELEELVSNKMIEEGREGQFFTTGKEGIEEYILSPENTVEIAIDSKDQVQSATYITQGQKPFTYNDITKYFKCGEKYNNYVRNLYNTENEYKKDVLKIFEIKLKAFEYAKNKVLEEEPKYKGNIIKYLQNELSEKDNEFHEKSKLRENLNTYMSEYIEKAAKEDDSISKLYDRFYWLSSEDISKIFNKEISNKSSTMEEYETLLNSEKSQEYCEILQKGPLKIFEEPQFNISKYYGANTSNSIELDTYITNPEFRQSGLARIIVYETIKNHIEKHFQDDKNSEIYLCSTLHRDNKSSKYVSEFFGLKDSLYVQRRSGRNREVHICKISKDEYKDYLEKMQDKLIVLYGYNPTNKKLSDNRKLEIIEEQLKYENRQVENLNATSYGNYSGTLSGVPRKMEKIENLQEMARKVRNQINRSIKAKMGER